MNRTDDIDVLKNLLHIKDSKELEQAEADITSIRLLDVDNKVEEKQFDFTDDITDYINTVFNTDFGKHNMILKEIKKI